MSKHNPQTSQNTTSKKIMVETNLKELPKVFVEWYSSVKISLVKNFIDCKDDNIDYRGCFIYDVFRGKLRLVSGIFYVPRSPFLELNEKFFGFASREIKEAIMDQIRFIKKHVRPKIKEQLLIEYIRGHYLYIYDKAIRGKTIKFPLKAQHENLYILEVPPLPVWPKLEYNEEDALGIGHHSVMFSKKVLVFYLKSDGDARLIYNHNDEGVNTELIVAGHENKAIKLESGKHYLIVHPKT